MPGMDGTGPFGTGPNGRGMGPCGGGDPAWGRGRAFRRGRGMGWRWMSAPFSQPAEKEDLERQKTWLETQLAQVVKRLQGEDKPQP